MNKKLRPPVKIFGGKAYLWKWIVEQFPAEYEKMNYVEPFIGAGSVFLNKRPSVTETINDLDDGIIRLWWTLQRYPEEFKAKLETIDYSQNSFDYYMNFIPINNFEYAIKEFVLRRMSRGGMKKNFAWSDRERGGKPGDVNAWETILKELPVIALRSKDVIVKNRNAIELIQEMDSDNTLFYLDPPYLHETRVSKNVYGQEMTDLDHALLLKTIQNCKGKVVLSGYDSQMYNHMLGLRWWHKIEKNIVCHAGQTKKKPVKTECLWLNF